MEITLRLDKSPSAAQHECLRDTPIRGVYSSVAHGIGMVVGMSEVRTYSLKQIPFSFWVVGP